MKLPIRVAAIALIIVSAVVAWATFQSSAGKPLDQFMPEGALLTIQAKNFSGLLHDWNASAERAQWLKSDNYDVFSRSRLFLRLGKASDEFALAAGLPPNMKFLDEIAGKETSLAVYDIGELHLLYISRGSSAGSFVQSSLWQSRNKFEPRNTAGHPFYYRKDPASDREVAFAMVDDTLVLGTRADLVAAALELMSTGKGRTLGQESWYENAISSAAVPAGDLRMVLHMEKIAVTPHFRTYWIQQNITEMQGYTSAVSDLYREGDVYREERVVLPKASAEDATIAQSSAAVTSLFALAPRDAGFYRASPTTAKDSLATVEKKILAPHFGAAAVTTLAPQIQLSNGQLSNGKTGSAADLETRIDVEPVSRTINEGSLNVLQKLFDAAAPQAMLVVESTRKNQDGVLLQIPTVVVLSAKSNWDAQAMQQETQKVVGSGLTTANLGTQWHQNQAGYYELDGLASILLAIRGKLLFIANDAAAMSSMLNAKPAGIAQPVVYAAGFDHKLERQNFGQLSTLVDHGVPSMDEPSFFSRNINSFSKVFARVGHEEVVVRQNKDKITQTVTYRWNN
jgi:hypothetical protein